MKKLLLVSTAVAGVALLSSPAHAALTMSLGGFFEGYGAYADAHAPAADHLSQYGIVRDSEVFFNGESTLDNGLTVGAHTQLYIGDNNNWDGLNADMNAKGLRLGSSSNAYPVNVSDVTNANTQVDESYLYASGGWGRVNFGQEDGAAYLLQVGAPSADSNVDGMRVYVQALNPAFWDVNFGGLVLDYQQADFRQTDRLTYLTPKVSGFQAGLSYAPQPGPSFIGGSAAGLPADQVDGSFKNPWEAAARWDGEFSGLALSGGAGYSNAQAQNSTGSGVGNVGSKDLTTYNFGGNVAMSGFSLGAAYKHSNNGIEANAGKSSVTSIWDVGAGYDNGPYHGGVSYFHETLGGDLLSTTEANNANVHRYAVGGGYTFGPGMTFRGSVDWGKYNAASGSADASARFEQVTVGTDVQF